MVVKGRVDLVGGGWLGCERRRGINVFVCVFVWWFCVGFVLFWWCCCFVSVCGIGWVYVWVCVVFCVLLVVGWFWWLFVCCGVCVVMLCLFFCVWWLGEFGLVCLGDIVGVCYFLLCLFSWLFWIVLVLGRLSLCLVYRFVWICYWLVGLVCICGVVVLLVVIVLVVVGCYGWGVGWLVGG